MAIGTRERTELRDQLTSQGYHWNYIDEWQPKVTLYRHAPMMSTNGEVVSQAGTALRNLPGNPDYISKKARIGLFTWPPSDTCTCRWCSKRTAETQATIVTSESVAEPPARKTRARGKAS